MAAVEPTLLGIPAGDWLAAAGGIIGVILTVIATLWIERRKGAQIKKPFRRAVVELSVALKRVIEPRIWADCGSEAVNEVIINQQVLMQILQRYDFARSLYKTYDLDVWDAVRALDMQIDASKPLLEKELHIMSTVSNHQSVFDINQENVSSAAYLMAFECDRVMREMKLI
ncbi:hypothetical protein [Allosphingosinicella indica]|uniref:Uncharacterized protein n=1 Tax=Allosphingosinicella indica TaxID=941907 RepID=A0A1X7GJB3_9SPHN|nr:hypothetical protein [Allosphingosinicella indica]SMF70636.1 hypothetical protein SAMN06295910_1918 [Allosphingosinicella indica]